MQTPAHATMVLIALGAAANHLLPLQPMKWPAELIWTSTTFSVLPRIQAVAKDWPKNNN